MRYFIIENTYDDGTVETMVVGKRDNGQQLGIPNDPANTDYAAYLEWVAAGNTPEPWQPDAE